MSSPVRGIHSDVAHPPLVPELVTPPAAQIDARRIVLVGTALWFVAFVVLLPFWTWLGRTTTGSGCGPAWPAGVLGLAGLAIMMQAPARGPDHLRVRCVISSPSS